MNSYLTGKLVLEISNSRLHKGSMNLSGSKFLDLQQMPTAVDTFVNSALHDLFVALKKQSFYDDMEYIPISCL